MTKKKKDVPAEETTAEEVTEGIQKLVKSNVQEPIVLDQEEDDEPQGPEAEDVVEVVEGEMVEEKKDPAEVAQLSRPPFEQRAREQPHAIAEKLKEDIFAKHSNQGQLAVEYAKAILSSQGLKSNKEQVVKYVFELVDAVQAEIDRRYNDEMTRRITGPQ